MGATNNPKLSRVCVENIRLRAYIGFIDCDTDKLQVVIIPYSFKYDPPLTTKTNN